MILIADSGATKTDWRVLYSRQDIRPFQTNGFNPFFVDTPHIKKEVDKELIPFIDSKGVTEVYFYGAGCSSTEKSIIVEDGLIPLFSSARIKVNDDLLGAARALCGHSEGIACILGTGSNSCLFDGKNIVENLPSLGYMLGDEGSGAYLGKKLLKEVLSMTAPLNIRELFEKKYNYSSVDILSHLYKQEFPSRFLASFTSFISENMNDAYIQGILKTSFIDFFETQVLKYSRHKEVPVFCTGSVAFYFSDILKEVANEKGIQIKNIVQSPIDGLTEYHLVDLEKFTAIKYSSDMEK
jgi:N-acetylglucosamine kinase-like BadF-type ATPase